MNLSETSRFPEFYQNHADAYTRWVNQASRGFNAGRVISWLEGFFGWSAEEYHLVFAPAMFPSGGYGVHYLTAGKLLAYQVIREYGESEEDPQFGGSKQIEELSLHEFGHTFVNPSIEAEAELIKQHKLNDFYIRAKEKMKRQTYGNSITFLNESVLRGVTAIGYGDFAESDAVRKEWNRKEKSAPWGAALLPF